MKWFRRFNIAILWPRLDELYIIRCVFKRSIDWLRVVGLGQTTKSFFCNFNIISAKNKYFQKYLHQAIDFFWQKFASEICWLIEQKCIHSAARIDIDMNLLSTLILHKRKRTAAENEGQNSINGLIFEIMTNYYIEQFISKNFFK